MRIYLFSIITFVFLNHASIECYGQHKKIGVNTASMEQQVIVLVNEYRQKRGLPKLEAVSNITTEARGHSKRMAKGSVSFGHAGFDARMSRLQKQLPKSIGFAENVAYGNMNAAAVVKMWLKSPGHKKNIRGKYTHTGVGIVQGKGNTIYFTQIFVRMR